MSKRKPKCECCGKTIKVASEDPDLCKLCFDDIFSGPPKAVITLSSFGSLVEEFNRPVSPARKKAQDDVLRLLGMDE